MISAEGALVVVVGVLPGFVASIFARGQDIEPRRRSATESIAFLLHFATYVHVVAVSVFLLLDNYHPLELAKIVTLGPREYFEVDTPRAIQVYGGYLLLVMLLAPLMGTYNLPRRLPQGIVGLLQLIKLAPKPSIDEEPIWYSAFYRMRVTAGMEAVRVRARMKNGDLYEGTLIKFPIVSDEISDKDFLIDNVKYRPSVERALQSGGHPIQVESLAQKRGRSGLLLNTANVESLEFSFFKPEADPDQSGSP